MPSLEFKGKPFVYSHHLSVPFRELVVDPEKSLPGGKKASLDDNLIIHGDNLEALKALLPRYAGKVDVIYIDPPYNTGNEGWAYNDNVNSPLMKQWLGKVVDRDDLERHDKWCSMMWPRLQLLKDLLSPGGLLLISIDDNEQHHLKAIADQIFGEECFVCCFVWRKVDSPNDNKVKITPDHEFILCYALDGDEERIGRLLSPQILEAYHHRDENGRLYRDRLLKKNGKNSLRRDRPSMFFGIPGPDKRLVFPIHENGEEACWAMGEKGIAKHEAAGTLIWKQREKGGEKVWEPYTREFAPDQPFKPFPTIWHDLPTMRQAKAMLRTIFGTADLFATPKPVELIERLLDLMPEKDAVVLDSFAGSGTTAHAVLAQNEQDGGNENLFWLNPKIMLTNLPPNESGA